MQPTGERATPGGTRTGAPARLRVLESVRTPAPTTNPYVVQLVRALQPWADVRYFSWPRALIGGYDVFHVHWPEVMLQRRSRAARAAARAQFGLLLLRLFAGRVPVVRTVHNVRTHETMGPLDSALLRGLDRRVTHWIRLNDSTPVPRAAAQDVTTVPHGHYVEWYEPYEVPEPVPGRLLFLGLIRPYKQVPVLVETFAATPTSGAVRELHVVGSPATPAISGQVVAAAAADPRIRLDLRYVDEATTARELGEAELVVLPYRELHNSGAALLALSLRRPVLVPRNEVTSALAAEVGPDWVLTYADGLSVDVLEQSLLRARRAVGSPTGPDLSRRGWHEGAAAHVAAFEKACAATAERR